ncbi:hypothetical protein Salat_2364600 [Sesamum alatum]|uniref:Uncharacterized protein n=1 Tax=Sesamum alatum TaxID=300844 RepID=A0AAE1XXQ3_9LAMI|nr:hypothetical protein Salat_2364600 [Sesamum alatum]
MVMIRGERHLNMPPPAYHPESQSITVGVFYGGELRNLPVATCIGGKLKKFDYVNATHMSLQTLGLFAEQCEQTLDHLGSREFTIYIKYKPPQPEEVAVECDEIDKHGCTEASVDPPILPPVIPQEVANQPEEISQNISQSMLTEPGPSMTQPTVSGPSMYEQLQMPTTTILFNHL